MKKFFTVFLYIIFAVALPVSVLGGLFSFLWLFSSIAKQASVIESVTALIAVAISATYVFTYVFSLKKTWAEKRMSIKTFLPAIHCGVAVAFLFVLTPVGRYIDNSTTYFGFAKKEFAVIEEADTHGGFVGDGSYRLIMDCSDDREKALEIVREWKKLPLSENLELMMYGGEKDGLLYGFNLAEEAKIPKVTNGYYMFKDRSLESKDSADDTALFERYSFNFSIAVYDCDTDRVYYFEFDT